ncbi:MAG TPA: Uma2 family endonuclease [Pyrinomonadaceae bacterium]|nr:Uma2 family endonuclease [Pyrinomonadaceae bacterium]
MVQELKSDSDSPAVKSSPLPKMTYEEFLAWYDDSHAEWVDGEVILMSPASDSHQELAGFLYVLLRHFAEAGQLGRVLIAPFQMKLSFRPSGREPDVLFIARERLNLLKNNYLDGSADMAIEVIGPDSCSRDREERYYEYQQAGVREYWILDPVRKQAEFFRLGLEGIYSTVVVGDDGIFHSAVLDGLWLKVDWLWQEPLPPLMSVLKDWGLVK